MRHGSFGTSPLIDGGVVNVPVTPPQLASSNRTFRLRQGHIRYAAVNSIHALQRLCTFHRSNMFIALLCVLFGGVSNPSAAGSKGCFVERDGSLLSLGNAAFGWQLDLSSGVQANFVQNRRTGQKFDLGKGAECSLRFSATLDRIELVD